jgi:alkylation response protein AidB-like acyl-CoA dehydrogenase
MDFELTEMQQMIRDTAREIGEEIIKPNRARWDEEEEFPWKPSRRWARPTCW